MTHKAESRRRQEAEPAVHALSEAVKSFRRDARRDLHGKRRRGGAAASSNPSRTAVGDVRRGRITKGLASAPCSVGSDLKRKCRDEIGEPP